jgi:hypothetical protein
MTHNSGYDQFPSVANGWRTAHPILDMAPPLLTEEAGPPTYKELNSGAIHIFDLPHYNRHGQAGFHHLSTRFTSLLDQGWAWASSRPARGLSVIDRLYWHRGLEKRRHLLPDAMRCGHGNPCMPGNTYSRAGIRPIVI